MNAHPEPERRVYFEDNLVDAAETDAVSNTEKPKLSNVSIQPAIDLVKTLLPKVGPKHRSAADKALLEACAVP